jgi:hypothetical protein
MRLALLTVTVNLINNNQKHLAYNNKLNKVLYDSESCWEIINNMLE